LPRSFAAGHFQRDPSALKKGFGDSRERFRILFNENFYYSTIHQEMTRLIIYYYYSISRMLLFAFVLIFIWIRVSLYVARMIVLREENGDLIWIKEKRREIQVLFRRLVKIYI